MELGTQRGAVSGSMFDRQWLDQIDVTGSQPTAGLSAKGKVQWNLPNRVFVRVYSALVVGTGKRLWRGSHCKEVLPLGLHCAAQPMAYGELGLTQWQASQCS